MTRKQREIAGDIVCKAVQDYREHQDIVHTYRLVYGLFYDNVEDEDYMKVQRIYLSMHSIKKIWDKDPQYTAFCNHLEGKIIARISEEAGRPMMDHITSDREKAAAYATFKAVLTYQVVEYADRIDKE